MKIRRVLSAAVATAVAAGVALMTSSSDPAIAGTTTETTTIVPYQAPGWRYLDVASGTVAGFAVPGFDDNAWNVGQAAFGSLDAPSCSSDNGAGVNTDWPIDTDLLLRRHFAVPHGATMLHVTGTVDDNAAVYLNGNLLTQASGGYCGTGQISIDIPPSILTSDNVLAARGIDLGIASFLDVQLTADVPATPLSLVVSPTSGSPTTRFTAKISGQCPGSEQVLVRNPATNSYLTGDLYAHTELTYDDSFGYVGFKAGLLGRLSVDVLCDAQVAASFPITLAGTSYVAMGDSYSSGEGAAESTFQPDSVGKTKDGLSTGCHRSPTSWSASVALRLKLTSWEFPACSGATVKDFYQTNLDYPFEMELPQILSIDPGVTTRVTFTIGGNDVGFQDLLAGCVYGGYGAPGKAGCKQALDEQAQHALNTLQTGGVAIGSGGYKTLSQVYLDVAHQVKPGGLVVVAGYPHLFGGNSNFYQRGPGYRLACHVGTAGGVENYWVDYNDAKWLNEVADKANTAIADQVKAADRVLRTEKSRTLVLFVPVVGAFSNHSLCDRDNSWINGVQIDTPHLNYKNTSFHPNYQGQRAYAGMVVPYAS